MCRKTSSRFESQRDMHNRALTRAKLKSGGFYFKWLGFLEIKINCNCSLQARYTKLIDKV